MNTSQSHASRTRPVTRFLRSTLGALPFAVMAILAGILFTLAGWALTSRPTRADSAGRGKVIDFEDSLIEGMNKKPYDSLSSLSEKNRRKKVHLYQKRTSFTAEQEESRKETRWVQ